MPIDGSFAAFSGSQRHPATPDPGDLLDKEEPMGPTLQSHHLLRVTLPSRLPRTDGCPEPILEVLTVGHATGPPPVDRRPVVRLALRGDLCRFTVGEIRSTVLDLVVDGTDLVLDLGDVGFLDAAALALFVELHHESGRRGGRFVLEQVNRFPRKVMEICGLDRVLVTSPERTRIDGRTGSASDQAG